MLSDIFSSLDYYTYFDEDVLSDMVSYLFFYLGVFGFCPNKGKVWTMLCPFTIFLSSFNKLVISMLEGSEGLRFGGLALGYYSIFWLVVMANYGGMVPASFSVSSQLSMGFVLAFIWWFWCLLSAFLFNWKSFLSHLLPVGTPLLLCPLMVMIESVSVFIRPITLAVRLVANITMGHLVLAMMSASSIIGIQSFAFGAYVLFEFFVCGLQGYVFTLLVSLYSVDHPSEVLQSDESNKQSFLSPLKL
uniref:ATP synthase subunit a n=1 Tax=Utterbackia peninsularis TaxID=872316 RepID=F4ZG82_9BIVA|nr:ATP synthase F0 subunit 6 [Utterbackia peninsularis]ADL62589.1 ATP synthase F0 subunit 6 [Utterbackia peninsularis]